MTLLQLCQYLHMTYFKKTVKILMEIKTINYYSSIKLTSKHKYLDINGFFDPTNIIKHMV